MAEHSKNGFSFQSDDLNQLTATLADLLETPQRTLDIGLNAWRTMRDLWAAHIAAGRLVVLAEALSCSTTAANCSRAAPVARLFPVCRNRTSRAGDCREALTLEAGLGTGRPGLFP
jgi:hypothetical protein